MKKIISIVLVLATVFTFFSCGGDGDESVAASIKEINDMYNAVSPSMVVTESTRNFGSYSLVNKGTLKVGSAGGFDVAVYEYSNEQLRDIESGSGAEVLGVIETVTGIREYHEELGYRENGGKWDEDGEDFTPETGAIALNLTEATVQDFKYDKETKTYTFTVLAANTEAVFGQAIESDVAVTLTRTAADIVGVTLAYAIKSKSKDHPEIQVTLKASYYYETQTITIN